MIYLIMFIDNDNNLVLQKLKQFLIIKQFAGSLI